MADRRKGKPNRSIGQLMRELGVSLENIGKDDPAAYDRRFRTPIRFLDELNDAGLAGQVKFTRSSPSNSTMEFPKSKQSFRGPDAMDDYLLGHVKPMKHEMMHVLQNIDEDPFQAASKKVGGVDWREALSNPGYNALHANDAGYGGMREKEAYLLSRTGRLNPVIREKLAMDNPEFNNPPNLLDLIMPNLQRNFPSRNRNYKLEQGRSEYTKHLPAGLRDIIDSIAGKGSF